MFCRMSIVFINWLNPFSSLVLQLYEMLVFSVVCGFVSLMHCARVAVVFKISICGAMPVNYNSICLWFCQLTDIEHVAIFILCIRPSVSYTCTVLKHIINFSLPTRPIIWVYSCHIVWQNSKRLLSVWLNKYGYEKSVMSYHFNCCAWIKDCLISLVVISAEKR